MTTASLTVIEPTLFDDELMRSGVRGGASSGRRRLNQHQHLPAYHVRPISYETLKTVLFDTHYIRKPGSTSVRLGLMLGDRIAGVVTYGTIPRPNARAICGPDYAPAVLELTRLALYDWAPRNSESWLIARSFEYLRANRPDIKILISYSDGRYGHVGTIYQATNWHYTGASTGDVVFQCEDGRVLHPRTCGWHDLPPGRWMPAGDKHRYVNFLGSAHEKRALRRSMRWPLLPYPKLTVAAPTTLAHFADVPASPVRAGEEVA